MLVGRFLQFRPRIRRKPAPALSSLSWPFFVWPGCQPANPVLTQVRTFFIPRLPAHARADAAFSPLIHAGGCEPQTLQTLFSGRTVAQCCARTPRIGFSAGRTPFAQRRLWPRKWPISGVSADGHPQHRRPESREARGFQARKRARRLSEPLCMVDRKGIEPSTSALRTRRSPS